MSGYSLKMRKWTLAIILLTVGCASKPILKDPRTFTSNDCHLKFRDAEAKDTHLQLDHASDLFRTGCYNEVIQMATYVRDLRRDKVYSFTSEVFEVLTPEGTFTPYILESYERSYLSLLIAISYLNLHRNDDALVELRRAVNEENAIIYNHGEDPVISLLLAVLWDRFDPSLARPHWQSLSGRKDLDPKISSFADARIKEIDSTVVKKIKWRIYGLGQLPAIDWHSQFFSNRPYKIVATSKFPSSCSNAQSLMMPTDSWIRKLSSRYDSDYHPLVYTKSLIRFPIGVAYGIVGISTGTALGVGGCVAAARGDHGGGELCGQSLKVAGALIEQSANFVEYTLRPDMRHWKNLPLAFVVNRNRDEFLAGECPEAADYSSNRQSILE